MGHQKKNPAKEPQAPLFEPAFHDMEDYEPMNIGGPGGTSTNTEHNEKGILESGLFRTMAHNPKTAELGASHPRQGIYAEGNTS